MQPSTVAYFIVCIRCGHFSGMHDEPNVGGCWAPVLVNGQLGGGVYGSALYEQPCRCRVSREEVRQQNSVLDACYE